MHDIWPEPVIIIPAQHWCTLTVVNQHSLMHHFDSQYETFFSLQLTNHQGEFAVHLVTKEKSYIFYFNL
jgi:hypothetical protein